MEDSAGRTVGSSRNAPPIVPQYVRALVLLGSSRLTRDSNTALKSVQYFSTIAFMCAALSCVFDALGSFHNVVMQLHEAEKKLKLSFFSVKH